MSDFRIGIDPGITGALALLEMVPDPGKSKVMAVLPMPVLPLGKHQQPNCDKLAEILVGWSHQAKIEPIVLLERFMPCPAREVSACLISEWDTAWSREFSAPPVYLTCWCGRRPGRNAPDS